MTGPVPIPFDAFAARAREFCAFVDRAEELDSWTFVTRLQVLLPKLYAAAIELPFPEQWPSKKEDVDLGPGPRECAALLDRLGQVLPVEDYWTTLQPLKTQNDDIDIGCTSLADDLADIYHDLLQGLRMVERKYPRSRPQFLWKHSFMAHWGEKLVEALRILHLVSFDLVEWRREEGEDRDAVG